MYICIKSSYDIFVLPNSKLQLKYNSLQQITHLKLLKNKIARNKKTEESFRATKAPLKTQCATQLPLSNGRGGGGRRDVP